LVPPPIIPPTTTSIAAKTNPVYIGSTTPTLSFSGTGNLFTGYTIAALNSLLDTPLGPVLQVLGVQVGGAQIAATSATCGAITLEQ
jgi:uncharacterized membrane protein